MKKTTSPIQISPDFNLRSVATIEELANHDIIYIYHHLNVGSQVQLVAHNTNLRGDIRYKVIFKNFTIGIVTLGGYFRAYYESSPLLTATILSMKKEKFLPAKEIDIEVNLIQLKNVS